MNIDTLQWDQTLMQELGIPTQGISFPTIRSCSSQDYGSIASGVLKGVPITGCVGDQQSATIGQRCFKIGEAKNTYGTGCFMLMNIGNKPAVSTHGLLTTLCYQFGNEKPVYALEGAVAVAGSGVEWLKNNMGIISTAAEIGPLAMSVQNTGGVYFVPAFSGLFAPHWRPDARGVIIGLTQYTTRAHIARALLESVCFLNSEIVDSMEKDSGIKMTKLKADGGMSNNNVVMQTQADLLGVPVGMYIRKIIVVRLCKCRE